MIAAHFDAPRIVVGGVEFHRRAPPPGQRYFELCQLVEFGRCRHVPVYKSSFIGDQQLHIRSRQIAVDAEALDQPGPE